MNEVVGGYEGVHEKLVQLVEDDPGVVGQFVAYVRGEKVVDLTVGDVAADDLIGIFSASKGASAMCIAVLVDRGDLDLDAPMAAYWPEFAMGGKSRVLVRTALSHQAGLCGVEPQLTLKQLVDHPDLAQRLAAMTPHWLPGAAHGYHGTTIGTLMEELVRRIDGRSLPQFFSEEIARPRGIDVYLATDDETEARVRPVRRHPSDDPSRPAPRPVDGLTGMTFNDAAGWGDLRQTLLSNVESVRRAGLCAVGGVASARGLARLYAMAIDEVDDMAPIMTQDTRAQMAQLQSFGVDLVLGMPTRFAIVFEKPDDRMWFGSHQAFGHDGAGGVMAAGDPWHDSAFAWVPHRMAEVPGADQRGFELAAQVRKVAQSIST